MAGVEGVEVAEVEAATGMVLALRAVVVVLPRRKERWYCRRHYWLRLPQIVAIRHTTAMKVPATAIEGGCIG